MPHSSQNPSRCPYCGDRLAYTFVLDGKGQARLRGLAYPPACDSHADLLALEPLDDRYLLTEDEA